MQSTERRSPGQPMFQTHRFLLGCDECDGPEPWRFAPPRLTAFIVVASRSRILLPVLPYDWSATPSSRTFVKRR